MDTKRKSGRPKGRTPVINFMGRLPLPLNAALERVMERTSRTKNAAIRIAIEEYVAREGEWPPPSNPSPE